MAVDPARAKSLFLNASNLSDPAERAAYLERECGEDAELRHRVEALLRASDGSPSTVPASEDATIDSAGDVTATGATSLQTPQPDLDPPPIPNPNTAVYRGNPAPDVLIAGRYTLREKIGEGGMGEVWVAKQTEPVKRNVALKLIRSGTRDRPAADRRQAAEEGCVHRDDPDHPRRGTVETLHPALD